MQKFGGTSVGDPDRIREVADHVARCRKKGDQVVLVVSAMGKETDELLRLAEQVCDSMPGREMDITIDKAGSYAEFTVGVETDAAGRLRVKQLDKVDLLLHSNGAARFAGEVTDISGDKSLRYTGHLVILANGLDFAEHR